MKRAIRQRCGFGCVICGYPLYEYDHVTGWANVLVHNETEITLLCPTHHSEATRGLLPREIIERANNDPHNLKAGFSKNYFLNYAGGNLVTDIGGNFFHTQIALMIDGQPIVGYQSDGENLLLYVKLFDEGNNLLLSIEANELVYSVDPWDIELVGTQLTLRAGRGRFILRLNFQVPNKLRIDRGILQYNGRSIQINDDEMLVDNNALTMQGCEFICPIGIMIGCNPSVGGCGIHVV